MQLLPGVCHLHPSSAWKKKICLLGMLVVEPDYLPDSEVLAFSLCVGCGVFIPHEVFTPQKYVHSSTRGSAEGGYPLCRVQGGYPLGWGVWGQAGPQRGFGGEAPEAKIAL
jgi:hypothetical protein